MTFALTLDQTRIAVVGLGYVGLPLAAALGREFPTLGFDIDAERVAQLESGHDGTGEIDPAELATATLCVTAPIRQRCEMLTFTSSPYPRPSRRTNGPT
jgi:UDP-N-acetyl-D-mannosaminuronate dehydrogenase